MSAEKPTLTDLLAGGLAENGETMADVLACIADSLDTNNERNCLMDIWIYQVAYPDFTAWTLNHVYYLHEYDGNFTCQSLPRNPPPTTTKK